MHDATILILEDDDTRITRFTKILNEIAPNTKVVYWRNAWKMIRDLAPYLPKARLISLDHDLNPEDEHNEDPGDGLMVAKFLAEQRPPCPIIVHTSNGDRAKMMIGEFELTGCNSKRVAPLGADWIESYWSEVVRSFLA
jgi:CheY-like chemotaxis protein